MRDSARVLGYPYAVGDKIAKLMPPLIMGRDTPLRACLEPVTGHEDGFKMASELRTLYDVDPDAKRVIDVARGLEGLRRQDGIHAAAVVITREPLTEYLPIQRKPEAGGRIEDAPIVTQYEMHGVEDLGLLKMDFLGLRNLDVLEITVDLVERSTGYRPDIDGVPLDDPKTFEMLRRGDTVGVFQLEGGPSARAAALARAHPVRGHRRPGRPVPAGADGAELAQRVRRPQERSQAGRLPAPRPRGDPRAHLRADDLPGAADAGRAAAGRLLARGGRQPPQGHRQEDPRAHRQGALQVRRRLRRQGHPKDFGERIFDTIEPFADYSFNKSHSVGYGYVAYQTAYLKANHPVEYLAALLTSVKTNKDQTAVFLNECRQLGIDVLVPDVNESVSDFSVHEGRIRFGMSAVRNVGEGVVAHIVAAHEEGGPFTDFYDFCDRVDPSVLNKRTIESLIKAGGFDSLGHPRQGLLHAFEPIIEGVLVRRRNEAEGQFDLFSALGDEQPVAVAGNRPVIPDTEFPKAQRLAFEKEMLGLYVSEHPMLGAARALRRHVECTLSELRDGREGEMKTVGGIVTALVRKYTKRGDLMGTFVLEDLAAALEVMVFPKTMAQYGHLLEDDAIVVVKGRLDVRDDTPKIIAMEISRPELALEGGPPVRVRVRLNGLSDDKVGKLKDILAEHPGDSPVFVHLETPQKTTVLRLGDDHLVDAGNGLFAELRVLLGADCIT